MKASLFMLLLLGALAGCSRQDVDQTKRQVREAGREAKQTAQQAGRELKREAHEAAREVKQGAHEASREIKRGMQDLKHKADAKDTDR